MTNFNYTQGPWKKHGTEVFGYQENVDQTFVIADCTRCALLTDAEQEANARLIAAAPDMLKAGMRLHDVLWSHFDGKMPQDIVDALAGWIAAEEKASGDAK